MDAIWGSVLFCNHFIDRSPTLCRNRFYAFLNSKKQPPEHDHNFVLKNVTLIKKESKLLWRRYIENALITKSSTEYLSPAVNMLSTINLCQFVIHTNFE